MALTDEQLERYSRHIILREIGVRGQKKLLAAKVLIIGAGGLGAPAAMYLAAAGVGTIGIADCDNVELSNLQRQIIHKTADIGKPKVQSAAETIKELNPDAGVITYHEYVNSRNIADMIAGYDFIIDGADNFPTKFLINDACVLGPERPPRNSHGDWPFLRPPERVPEGPVVSREHLPQLEKIQEVLPSRRDEAHFR